MDCLPRMRRHRPRCNRMLPSSRHRTASNPYLPSMTQSPNAEDNSRFVFKKQVQESLFARDGSGRNGEANRQSHP